MINLKDDKYIVKKILTKESILEYISDYDIFKYYIPGIELKKKINSPLREDKNPSFNIFWYPVAKRIFFKDLGSGDKGDSFNFVERIKNCDFQTALKIIAMDFRLDKYLSINGDYYTPSVHEPIIHSKSIIEKSIKESVCIQITERKWLIRDMNYWGSYGISKNTLIKYRVRPIQYMFIDDIVYGVDSLAYAYTEFKDGVVKYKIYQPALKENKWFNNFVDNTLSGFSQLTREGDLLIIASSLKDAMCLHDLGYTNVIAPQTENYIFKQYVLDDLKWRFKRVVLFYDHDDAGIKASEHMRELFNLDYITTGTSEFKDPSDYYKFNGREKLLKLIQDKL